MKNLFTATLLPALLVLAAAGCQNSVNTMENSSQTMQPQEVSSRQFVTDSYCRDRLQLLSLRKSMTPGGVLQVQAELRSQRYGFFSELWSDIMGANPYRVLYRFDWFDENGMQVSSAADAWQHVIFIPGETQYLKAVAPNARCRDFRLSLVEEELRSSR